MKAIIIIMYTLLFILVTTMTQLDWLPNPPAPKCQECYIDGWTRNITNTFYLKGKEAG